MRWRRTLAVFVASFRHEMNSFFEMPLDFVFRYYESEIPPISTLWKKRSFSVSPRSFFSVSYSISGKSFSTMRVLVVSLEWREMMYEAGKRNYL